MHDCYLGAAICIARAPALVLTEPLFYKASGFFESRMPLSPSQKPTPLFAPLIIMAELKPF